MNQRTFTDDALGAVFSPCRKYRYLLWRRWGEGKALLWIMLNPSTADELHNDPTVERCQRRSVALGFSAMEVCNLFAFRSTDPKGLLTVDDPIGPDNDRTILERVATAGLVACGWGCRGGQRGFEFSDRLRGFGARLHCLGLTASGHPKHPLYVPYHNALSEWINAK